MKNNNSENTNPQADPADSSKIEEKSTGTPPGLEEYIDDFLEEFRQAIISINKCLDLLDNKADDIHSLDTLFRNAHNMKGGCNALGFPRLGGFFALIEAAIEPSKKRGLPFTAHTAAAVRKAALTLERAVELLKETRSDSSLDLEEPSKAMKWALEKISAQKA